jgi:hypothetical protein
MPSVARKATPVGEPEQLIIETESSGKTYEYTLALDEHPTDDADGRASVRERARVVDGAREEMEPDATQAVRDELQDRGYKIQQ